MKDTRPKVIGIDPASGEKGSYVFALDVTDPKKRNWKGYRPDHETL